MDKKIIATVGLGIFILGGIAATPVLRENKPKNLKIIPHNIDDEQLDRVMNKFNKALGVPCSYCHAKTKPDVFPMRADFASDEKPAKRTARNMMRMTDKLNRKYFNYKNSYDFNSFTAAAISCQTCHQGQIKPSNFRLYPPHDNNQ